MRLEAGPPAQGGQPAQEPLTCAELDSALRTDTPLCDTWSALPQGHHDEYGRWVSAGEDAATRGARITRLRHRLLPQQTEVSGAYPSRS